VQVLAATCVVSAPIIAAAKERAEVLAKQAADKAAAERKHAAASGAASSGSAAEPSKSGAGGKKGAAASKVCEWFLLTAQSRMEQDGSCFALAGIQLAGSLPLLTCVCMFAYTAYCFQQTMLLCKIAPVIEVQAGM
jgi:hypothetical protein